MNETRRFSRMDLPDRAGAGFKPEHAAAIVAEKDRIGFLEVHAENYMGDGGTPHRILSELRRDLPLSIHGVGLSIGAPTGLDPAHLARLKGVVERYEPGMVSEHLAWSTHDTTFFNDLLPVPYDDETLTRVVDHIGAVQDALGRPILLENPSTYVAFQHSTMSETDFIREIARRSGCGLLLDINNVEVSAFNLGLDPVAWINAFDPRHVGEIHVAGHAVKDDDMGGTIAIDDHGSPVRASCWDMLAQFLGRSGPKPVLIEWDTDVPDYATLMAEAAKADAFLRAPVDA